jgi:hypothetical protein
MSKGVVNGAMAIVIFINFDDSKNRSNIIMRILNIGFELVLKQCYKKKYTYENNFYKAIFPIILGYAITSYKTQGTIISNKIIVKIQNAFAPSLTYVM